ncbi:MULTISPECIES: Fur family transcriptional regulator [unclassified Streptomyces]|uniref:Fur family transcriptional regulator n=1 Tax=unclassified Streptomyces TaxID=2593676 RepID=UPI00056C2A00|nr:MULTISPECIES: Fur family transcriptional regulator [unclassified Streptomyces]MYT30406.1 transcriptional repressor [Streptomyces sp. SID8354]
MARNRPHTAAPSQDVALIGRLTQQRAIILEALVSADDFIGAQALHNQLAADGSPVGLTTVYRTLTALAGAGRADVVRDTNGERLFRYRPGPDHRHYLLCTECGLSQPVDSGPVETWAKKIARTSGFANLQHTLELSGVCPDCRERSAAGE